MKRFKEYIKPVKNFFTGLLILIIINILALFSVKKIYDFGEWLAKLAYKKINKYRKRMFNNIKQTMPEKSTKQVNQIVSDVFRHITISIMELVILYKKPKYDILKNVNIINEDIINKAYKNGKGIINIMGHFGNFALLISKLSKSGYNVASIIRPMPENIIERMFMKYRKNAGIETIYAFPRDRLIKEAFACIRNGNILNIAIDLKANKGITIKFMGQPSVSPIGVGLFAVKSDAPVIPVFIIRNPDYSHSIIFEKPIPVIKTGDYKNDITQNLQNFMNVIEKYIKKYPEQWFWFHRRWN